MADVRINLRVSSNGGIAAEADQAARLGDNLERATVASRNQQRLARSGLTSTGSEPDRQSTYRQSRGTTGGTGAEARDFSRQAAGLGGLVHVYATFAANIFALTSAFNSLSKAMDTSNMVKGLDQLGAASGKNLSGLAKQLVGVSEGAIALKDALTATAQASSGGLAGQQLLRLAEIAKKASQALGRDMTDSLSRLTRGITKIEPELLDELGILVKVDKANQDYARSLGKTASALTDLEKRQAFANATLDQGEQKFKDISIASNPYQKIIASITNLTQVILELVNTALSPLVDILSKSPTALTATISAFAAMLLKQAIPALGQWRAGLEETAARTRRISVEINEAFRQFEADNANRAANAISQRMRAQQQVLQGSMENIRRITAEGVQHANRDIANILNRPIQDITDTQLSRIEEAERNLRTRAQRFTTRASSAVNQEDASFFNRRAEAIERQAEAYRTLREEIPKARQEHAQFIQEQERAEAELARQRGVFSEAAQRQRVADRAERKAAQAEVLSNVGRNTQVMGARGAFAALRADIKEGRQAVEQIGRLGEAGYVAAVQARRPLEGLAATGTLIRGTFTIATSAVIGFLSAFGPWAAVIGLAAAALGTLVDLMSSNSEEIDKFKSSLQALDQTTKLYADTIAAIDKKPFLEKMDPDSILARASAFNEVSTAISKTVSELDKADKAASGFDKFIDVFKKVWGGDLRSRATEGMTKALSSAIVNSSDAARDQLEKSLSSILNTNDFSAKGLETALNNVPLEKFKEVQFKISEAITATNTGLQKQSTALVNVKGSLDEVGKAASTLIIDLTAQDPFTKFAVSVTNASNAMAKALDSPITATSTLIALMGDVGRLSALSPEMSAEILGKSTELKAQTEALESAKQAVKLYGDEIIKVTGELSQEKIFTDINKELAKAASLPGLKKGKQEALKIQQDLEVKVQSSSIDLLKRAVEDSFKNSANLIAVSMKNAQEAAGLTIAKAAAAGLQGPGTADVQYKLRLQEIDLQEKQLKLELELLTTQNENRAAIERLNNTITLDTQTRIKQAAEANLKTGTGNKAEQQRVIDEADKVIKSTNKAIELSANITKNLNSLKGLSPKEADTKLKSAIAQAPNVETKAALQATQTQILGALQKQIANDAERAAAAVTKNIEATKEQAAVQQAILDDKSKSTDLDLKSVTSAQGLSDIYDSALQARKELLSLTRLDIENDKKKLQFETDLSILKQRSAYVDTARQQAELKTEFARQQAEDAKARKQQQADNTLDRLTREEKERLRLQDISNKSYELDQNNYKAQLSLSESVLSAKSALQHIEESDAIFQQGVNAKALADLEKESAIRKANQEYTARQNDLTLKYTSAISQAKIAGQDTTTLEQQKTTALQENTNQYNEQIGSITTINNLKKAGIDIDTDANRLLADYNKKLERQAELTSKIDSIADSLTKAFGDAGRGVGNIAKILQKSAVDQVAIAKKKSQEIEKIESKGGDPKEKAKVETKYAQESASAQMSAAADIAGAVADSFGQQSGAAKEFHKIEKAFHIAKLAMDIESIASTFATVVAEEAAASATALAWIPAVWARAFGEGGPFAGWALGAAAIAMIGLGKGKGSGSGRTSEQLQKVQGTGQTYDANGKIINTAFTGVLGDRTAKSQSIPHSLDLIAKYTFDQLEYSNKMLTALQDISNSLSGVSKNLALTSGLLSGSAFGTTEGTSSKTGLGAILGGIFGGGKSSTEIIASGIKVAGTVSDLAKNQGLAQQYETVKTTSSGGLFGLLGSKSKTTTNVQDLSQNVVESLGLVFTNIKKTLVEVGKELGLGAESLMQQIDQIPVDLSIDVRGLKGKELEDEVSAVLSATLDNITEQALSLVKPYQKVGEGLAETAVRVANDSRVIDLSLKSIGALNSGSSRLFVDAKEKLLDLMGGIEDFVSKTNYFKDNFLTESEKLVPVQKAVTDELQRLGLTALDSKDKFKSLVQSLDLNDSGSQQLYASLMNLAEGFNAVYGAADKLSDDKLDQLTRVMQLLGDKAGVNLNIRKKELKTIEEKLQPMQLWIYALEDEADARDALTKAYQSEYSARSKTIDSLKQSKQTLLDFSKSIALSQTSPLTPAEKYAEAKKNLEGVTKVLNDALATPEERQKALDELPNAITSLLDTSKIFNASSEAFQQDYQYSQKLLAENSTKLDSQITTEEQSLQQLQMQVRALGAINDSVIDVKDAIGKLADQIAETAKAAAGVNLTDSGLATSTVIKSTYAATPGLRANDTAGQNYWTDVINSGAINMKDALENIHNMATVTTWYDNILGKGYADLPGIVYWANVLKDIGDISAVKRGFAVGIAKDYNINVPSIDRFAKGGLGNGLAIVGEEGPELVNFERPGRVYSNSQSNNIMDDFTNKLTNQVATLTKQVETLTEEARINAALVAQAMYNSNMAAADKISGTIESSDSKQDFNRRNTANLM